MSNGGGHATLVETMAVLGVPVMNKRCFISTERRIGEWWGALLEESMRLASQEERELAIARGTTCVGDPAITVILNGGWSKRTHKHSYNAKSGVAIIIGYEFCLWEYATSIVVYVPKLPMVKHLTIPVLRTGKASHQLCRQT